MFGFSADRAIVGHANGACEGDFAGTRIPVPPPLSLSLFLYARRRSLTLALLAFHRANGGHSGVNTQLSNAFLSEIARALPGAVQFKRRQHCPVQGCSYADGGKTLRHLAALLDHYGNAHFEGKSLLCGFIGDSQEECKECFGTASAVREHKRSKHRSGKLECVACPLLFANKRKLEHHANGLNAHIAAG